ncbi:MAG: type I-U CRISPR-associated protein Csx17 [Vulcanimicrobiota bacterium]
MNEILLDGCRVKPLAAYLKALGTFRILARQKDRAATLRWRDEVAVLSTTLNRDQLIDWFSEEYQPTPITSPWNGRSGYFPSGKAAKKALDQIDADSSRRFEPYRKTLAECRNVLSKLGLSAKPDSDSAKPKLMRTLRATLTVPEALEWLDAACVLRDGERLDMVPLLGTGGNDGSLDFSSNFAQNLANLLLCPPKKVATTKLLLRQALFDEPCNGLGGSAIGQFSPGSAGGPNTTSGFDGSPNVNPWDFVLALEGSLAFSAAATRRLSDDSQGFSLPFTVDPSMGGHPAIASDEADKARCEMWLPTWAAPITLAELRAVFAEGRAQVGGRQAASGVDFARAVASLGVERGFDGFERYTFLVRNGKSYFASPAGRYRIRPGGDRRAVDLLTELDPWLRNSRRKAESHGGANIRSLFRQFDDAVLELCRKSEPSGLLKILRVLGGIQRQLAQMPKLHQKSSPESYVRPIPQLSADWWPEQADTAELRLAMGLRGLKQVRQFVWPIARNEWKDEARDAVWTKGRLSLNLSRLLKRRFLFQPQENGANLTDLALQRWRFRSWTDWAVLPEDISGFLYEKLDDGLIEEYFLALLLVELPAERQASSNMKEATLLPVDYGKLKVAHGAFDPREDIATEESDWLCPRTVIERLNAGQLDGLNECDRFLIAKGRPPKQRGGLGCLDPPRLSASLAFPISWPFFAELVKTLFPKLKKEEYSNVH